MSDLRKGYNEVQSALFEISDETEKFLTKSEDMEMAKKFDSYRELLLWQSYGIVYKGIWTKWEKICRKKKIWRFQ